MGQGEVYADKVAGEQDKPLQGVPRGWDKVECAYLSTLPVEYYQNLLRMPQVKAVITDDK